MAGEEDFDDDLLAVAGISRQPAGKKRSKRVVGDSSDELSGDEGQAAQPARTARKGASTAKKRRVVTPRAAEQVCAATFLHLVCMLYSKRR